MCLETWREVSPCRGLVKSLGREVVVPFLCPRVPEFLKECGMCVSRHALQPIAGLITEKTGRRYEFTGISFRSDDSNATIKLPAVTLERRIGALFGVSRSPLHTDDHCKALEQLEGSNSFCGYSRSLACLTTHAAAWFTSSRRLRGLTPKTRFLRAVWE